MTRDDNTDVEELRKAYTDDAFTFLKEESKLVNVIMELTNNQNSEAVAQSVRGFTIKLYTILHMKKKEQIKALQAKVEEQETQLSQSDFVIDELKKQLGFSKETIAERDKEIRLLKTISEDDGGAPNYRAGFSKLNEINATLKKEIAHRDWRIEMLEEEKKDLENHIERYEALNGVMPKLLIPAEPANYREELKKLKDENDELKAKLKNRESLEAIANTRPFDVNILETEWRNTTKKYSILEEAFIKIRDIATSL